MPRRPRAVGPRLLSGVAPPPPSDTRFATTSVTGFTRFDAVDEGGDLIEDLAALVMNIPMFEASGLQITKSSDRARAEIGDIVTYRVEVHNPTASTVSNVTVEDRLPSSFRSPR